MQLTPDYLAKLVAAFLMALGLLPFQCACSDVQRTRLREEFKDVSLYAKEHGFAGAAHFHIGGEPSFDLRTGGVANLDVYGDIHLQFNSLAEPRGKAQTAVGEGTGQIETMPEAAPAAAPAAAAAP